MALQTSRIAPYISIQRLIVQDHLGSQGRRPILWLENLDQLKHSCLLNQLQIRQPDYSISEQPCDLGRRNIEINFCLCYIFNELNRLQTFRIGLCISSQQLVVQDHQ